MNWGHRLKLLVVRNWREKIISFVLAFLFWFMIKAQDARHPTYIPPPPVRVAPTIPAPPQLEPTIEPTSDLPEKLAPVLPAVPTPKPPAAASIGKATEL